MAYPFLTAGQPIQYSPKQEYTNQFQQTLFDQFYNASNVYTVLEETNLASGIYQNVDVRVNDILDSKIGDKIVDDDLKLLSFADISHNVNLGQMYQFDSNYWITSNVDKIKSLVSTATVKRCNNMLRWQTPDGAINEFPASLNFILKQNKDYSTAGSAVVTPAGTMRLITQFNSITNSIQPNQRFLFGNSGNWTAYRIEGGGIENFNNLQTTDNTSVGLITFTLVVDYVNLQTDNVTLGIANYIQGTYLVTLSKNNISGDVGQSVQLQGTVTFNDQTVSRSLNWVSSDVTIATVDNTGLVTFVGVGSAVITANLLGNLSVSANCNASVGVTPVDNYQIFISPNVNYILENTETIWTATLFKNDVAQADTFVFSLNPNTVPDDKYIYEVIDGNNFKIHNYGMFLTDTLDVTMTSGIYSRVLNVNLRGAW